jgi:hypothetical protein
MIRVPNVRAKAQYIFRSRSLHVTIAQEREPVLVAICVVVVFPSRSFDRLEEVDGLYRGLSQYAVRVQAVFCTFRLSGNGIVDCTSS